MAVPPDVKDVPTPKGVVIVTRKTLTVVGAAAAALCIATGVAQAANPGQAAARIKTECSAVQGGEILECAQTVVDRECAGDQVCVDQALRIALGM